MGKKKDKKKIKWVEAGTLTAPPCTKVERPKGKKKPTAIRMGDGLVPNVGFKFEASISRRNRIMLMLSWARETSRIRVDDVFYDAPGGWVDGWLLSHRTIGGPSADRRIRDLRLDPGGIEKRSRTDHRGDTIIEYRLAARPERTSKGAEFR